MNDFALVCEECWHESAALHGLCHTLLATIPMRHSDRDSRADDASALDQASCKLAHLGIVSWSHGSTTCDLKLRFL